MDRFEIGMVQFLILGLALIFTGLTLGVQQGFDSRDQVQAYVDEHCLLKSVRLTDSGDRVANYACRHGNHLILEEYDVNRKGKLK